MKKGWFPPKLRALQTQVAILIHTASAERLHATLGGTCTIPKLVSCSNLPLQEALFSRDYTESLNREQPFSLAIQAEVVQAFI